MSRQRFSMLAIAALVALSAALYLSTRRNAPRDVAGVALLHSLAGDLNAVTGVAIRKGSTTPTVSLHKTANAWTVAQRGDYPADTTKLRRLLSALRDAKIIEEKTADPARYAAIGVGDPTVAGSTGAEVSIEVAGATEAVIIGKPVGEGNFVRRAGEKHSYVVEPAIAFETEPRFWIDPRLVDVPATLIQSMAVKPATGGAYTLHRSGAADGAFSLDGVPTGRQALEGAALAPPASLLTGLNSDDVAPADSVDFSVASQAIVTLTDGTLLTFIGASSGDKHWVKLTSSKDSTLAAKTRGRAFEVASYRYDALFKPLDQLLVPQEPTPTRQRSPPAS